MTPRLLLPAALLSLLPLNLMAQQAGDPDPTFGVDGKVLTDISGDNDEGHDVALQPDGKIVVGAISTIVGAGFVQFAVVRYLPDGNLDPAFGVNGVVLTRFGDDINALAHAIAVQPDGKIIAAGYTVDNSTSTHSFAIARYLPDGTLDTSFSEDGKLTLGGLRAIEDIVLQQDGKIVAVGTGGLARFNADGSLDPTFGVNGQALVADFEQRAGALQPDGRIVTAGQYTNSDPFDRGFALARYLPDGSLDPTFGTGGRVNTSVGGDGSVGALTLQSDGRIIAAGDSVSPETGVNFTLLRYLPDGSLDPTFDGDGVVTTHIGTVSGASGVALQADGEIVVSGRSGLARYLPDGSLDTTFGGGDGFVVDFGGSGLAIQPDGRLVVGGAFSPSGQEGGFDITVARYLAEDVPGVGPPTNKNQCKNGGWRTFTIPRTFSSQGDCITFVNTGS